MLGKKRFYYSMGLSLALGLSLATQNMLAQAVTTTTAHRLSDGSEVEGSSSTLVRAHDGVTYTFLTSDLELGNAYSMWLVIFNNPEKCSPPGCGADDLLIRGGDPSVGSSVVYGNGGGVITSDGKGNFGGHLKVGDAGGALFGPGLLNAQKAEIHPIVRSHGPIKPDMLGDQISSFDLGCPEEGCMDVQAAAHLPHMDPNSMRLSVMENLMKRMAAAMGVIPWDDAEE